MYTNELIDSTLVPIDFSDSSFLALDHAVAIAKINEDAQVVTLLHIVEGSNFNSVTDISQVSEGDRDALAIEGALNRLNKIADKYKSSDNKVTFKFLVASGKPYRKIAQIAKDINADVIVMGTHGSSGVQAFAGSNASKVIQIAPCPVVVIKEKAFSNGYKNIVLPLDLTLETKQKVAFAVRIAEYYNSTIHLISMSESDEFLSKRLENNMTQVERYLTDRGIKTTSTILDASGGNFARQTIVWAQGKDADLIVIMSQQEKGLSEFIYGSYAQQIVNKSPIPVMAVNPNPELEGLIANTVGSGIYSH
jgi:nucleotide-binding universal stress UspA family protein